MRDLPDHASLDHLRRQAKDQLAVLRRTAPGTTLGAAQATLARQYGFGSWADLKAEVERRHQAPPTAADDHLTERLATAFGLGAVTGPMTHVERQWAGEIWDLTTTGGRWVVTGLAGYVVPAHIETEAGLVEQAIAAGVLAPTPVRSTAGPFVATLTDADGGSAGAGGADDNHADRPDHAGAGGAVRAGADRADRPVRARADRADHARPGGADHARPGGADHARPGGADHAGADRPDHAGADRPDHAGADRPDHAGAGDADHAGAGDADRPDRAGAGDADHARPGRADHAGDGGAGDTGDGGAGDAGDGCAGWRVHRWVPLGPPSPQPPPVDVAAEGGRILARIHSLDLAPPEPVVPWLTRRWSEAHWQALVDEARAADTVWADDLARAVPGFLALDAVGDPRDPNPRAVLSKAWHAPAAVRLAGAGRLVAVGWEHAGAVPRDWDLGASLMAWSETVDNDYDPSAARAFLAGYRELAGSVEIALPMFTSGITAALNWTISRADIALHAADPTQRDQAERNIRTLARHPVSLPRIERLATALA